MKTIISRHLIYSDLPPSIRGGKWTCDKKTKPGTMSKRQKIWREWRLERENEWEGNGVRATIKRGREEEKKGGGKERRGEREGGEERRRVGKKRGEGGRRREESRGEREGGRVRDTERE